MQQAAGFTKLQNKFGISQASLGSLSESVRIFDPERFKEIAKELGDPLPRIQHRWEPSGKQHRDGCRFQETPCSMPVQSVQPTEPHVR